jgi:hypothetical protein
MFLGRRKNEGVSMTKLAKGLLASALVLGGCATTEHQDRLWETPPPPEAYILGSKLQRSEYLENYQGVKSISAPDYRQYKREVGGEPPMR